MKQITFKTTLRVFGNNTGIEVPLEELNRLGSSKKPSVHVTIGTYTYASSVGSMKGLYLIPFAKVHRDRTGLKGGELILVTLSLIEGKRIIDIPDFLKNELKKMSLYDAFIVLAPSHQKEWIRSIEDAKKDETKQARIEKLIRNLTTK